MGGVILVHLAQMANLLPALRMPTDAKKQFAGH
jgi:hypothetical protein